MMKLFYFFTLLIILISLFSLCSSFSLLSSTPACDSSPTDSNYDGYYEWSNIVIIDPSVTVVNHTMLLNSLFISTYNLPTSALWDDSQYAEWFSGYDSYISRNGWSTNQIYESDNLISLPVPNNQNISTFNILSNFFITNGSLPQDVQPLLPHAACQLDNNIGSSASNNFVNITRDPYNSPSEFSKYAGNIWVIAQDGSVVTANYMNIVISILGNDCEYAPWISCYQQSGGEVTYALYVGSATFNPNNFNGEKAQTFIDDLHSDYNNMWGKFWSQSSSS